MAVEFRAILAMPTAPGVRTREILTQCREAGIALKTLPSLQQLAEGTLKLRPLGKPVHVPSPRDKVAQRPAAWDKQEALI